MSACPQCGTVAKPTDKFCNTCGTPLAAAPAAYGAPPAPPMVDPGYAAPAAQGAAPARCQMGHEIAPGASYCAQGHPIALDAMQFAADPYANPQQGYGQGAAQPQGFGAPPQPPAAQYGYAPPPQPAFGAPQGGFGAPQPGFGAPPQGFAPQQPPPYQPSPSPIGGVGGFGADPSAQNLQQGYGQPPPAPGFGAPGGFGQPPAPPAYAPQAQGFGAPPPAPPQQPVFNAPAAPPPALNPYASASSSASATATADPNNKTIRGFLIAYQTNPVGDFWPLAGGRVVIGRAGAVVGEGGIDIQLADPTISSRHAAFVVDGAAGTIALEDTGSTNGTFVNDEHVGFNGRRELKDGDRVRFGGFTTIVKVVGRV